MPIDGNMKPEEVEVLAGEYILGLLDASDRDEFERLALERQDVAEAILQWQERLGALNDAFPEIVPPAQLKQDIAARLFSEPASAAGAAEGSGLWHATGFWRALALVSSALLIALALYTVQLAGTGDEEQPVLVVSLQSGETDYRFLAVHEPGTEKVRMTLVSGAVEAEKDFELWLVDPENDTVSLGVIEEGGSVIPLADEHAEVLRRGGKLAVSIEQKGGSPTGVAEGPVVAVGEPHEL